ESFVGVQDGSGLGHDPHEAPNHGAAFIEDRAQGDELGSAIRNAKIKTIDHINKPPIDGGCIARGDQARRIHISSSPVATAVTLNGDAEIALTGAIGNVRAYVQGFTDLVFVGGVKNFLTHSIVAKPEIKR